MKRRSLLAAEVRAAGRQAYYDGVPMGRCPHRLADGRRWRAGWLDAQREVDEFIARQIEAAVDRVLTGRQTGR